jgi:hypothetical protein
MPQLTSERQMAHFAKVLLFFNTIFVKPTHFYKLWDHKFLGNREICHMFTKSNTRGGKMNGCGSMAGKMSKRNRGIPQSNAQVAFENV